MKVAKQARMRTYVVVERVPHAQVKIVRRIRARTKEAAEARALRTPYKIPVMPSKQHDLVVDGLDVMGFVDLEETKELRKRRPCRDSKVRG